MGMGQCDPAAMEPPCLLERGRGLTEQDGIAREAKDKSNRSGCQNITLVITSSDGVPCAHGHAPLIATGTLGTDSA